MSKDHRHHFLIVFLTGSLGILIGLSLVPTGEKPNLLGNLGSHISYFLYSGFGLWGWMLPLVFFRFAVARFTNEPLVKPGLKLLGLLLALVSLCAITRVMFPNVQMFSTSQMREGVEWSGRLWDPVGDHMEAHLSRPGQKRSLQGKPSIFLREKRKGRKKVLLPRQWRKPKAPTP